MPFLDIADLVMLEGHLGLLGIAFHPEYARTGVSSSATRMSTGTLESIATGSRRSPLDGWLYIADVGESSSEEVNAVQRLAPELPTGVRGARAAP